MIAEFVQNQIAGSEIIGGILAGEHAIGQAFVCAGRTSVFVRTFGPLFARFDLCRRQREESGICAAFSWLFSLLLRVVRAVYNAFARIPGLRLLPGLADAVLKLHFCDVCAVLASLMLCIYHDNWNNGYMLIAAVLVSALYLIRLTRLGRKPSRLPVSLYLFILSSAAIIPLAGGIGANLRVYTYFISAFAFFFCLAGSIENLDDMRRVLMILYVAVLYNAFLSIIQGHYGVPVNLSYTDVTTNPDTPGRVYASFSNPNNFAEILCLLMPGCFAAFMSSRQLTKAAKAFAGLSFVFPVLALVLTYSRSAWISFALTVCASIGLLNLALIPVALVLVVAAIPFLPYSVKNRIMSLFSGTDSSVGYRIYIWQGCYGTMANEPLGGFGLGPDNFFLAYSRFMNENAMKAPHSHNLFLEIWMETGAVGILSYLAFFITSMKGALLHALRKGSRYRYFSVALFSAMFGLIFMSMVEYIWFYPRTMLCFFLVLGMIWALLRMAAAEEAAADEKNK